MDAPVLKVLYNATSARIGGGLSYATQQINALAMLEDLRITVLTSPWNHEHFAKLNARAAVADLQQVSVLSASWRFLWEQTVLPRLARQYDAIICPGNFAPWFTRTPVVLILQNPNYVGAGRKLPQNRPLKRRAKIIASMLSMRRASQVVLISDSLKAEFEKEPWLAACSRIVVRSGAPRLPAPSRRAVLDCLDGVPLPRDFLVSVANDYPHKRLTDISLAFARLQPATVSALVFIGDVSGSNRDNIRDAAGVRGSDVIFLGAVGSRSAVASLYGSALAAVSASELEAFPLTLHEAGAMGCRLILSDIPPHRELAHGHATFFPLADPSALTTAIENAAQSPRPRPWTWTISWEAHAEELNRVLHDTVKG